MKRFLLFLTLFSASYVLSPNSSAALNPVTDDAGAQFGFFFSSLAHHGEWIEVEAGTHVWRPFHISRHWRPYLIGRWVWTDDGWYWMSDEPFGWITYHYGRWYYDDYYGWVWMPDDVWAPAWVEWRYDDEYIGWAPLPPYATFNISFGIRFTTHWSAPPRYWNVVRYQQFGSVIRYRDTAPVEYTKRLIHSGRPGPQFGVDRERIINNGVDRSIIERRGNVRFERIEIREVRERAGERMARSADIPRIEIFRPTREEMQRRTGRIEARHGERSLSIDMKKVERSRIEPRTPQVEERQPQRDRQEMRHDLIQRHESRQNPSPPSVRESRQNRTEQRRENSRSTQPDNTTQDERSGDKRTR